ncbi:hypothetical protein LHJ74_11955 [Streptomyces sp. N2-109]|uniref:Transposase n=1 Tax=Streptomyces gossypii TaxID=2883101 RepID=A0ABT2JRU3_9ACTN|nr:hypothetical protein [Streptomyces gossypii]
MTHGNAPLGVEGRRRLVTKSRTRRSPMSQRRWGSQGRARRKWVDRWRRYGEMGIQDRPSSPHASLNVTGCRETAAGWQGDSRRIGDSRSVATR